MYTGGTTLGSLNKVFHDGYHPNADTLTTARTINGVSFNGSANITVADATKLPLTGGTLSGDLTLYKTSADTNLTIQGHSQLDPILTFKASTGAISIEGAEIWYDNSVGDLHIHTTYADDAAAIRFHTRTGASKSTSNERMTIAGNGKVGIGTVLPETALHVNGLILINNANEIRSKDTSGNQKTIVRINSSNELEYGWSGAGPVKFMGGGSYTERMRIHTDGNVGIGESNPVAKIHIQGSGTSGQVTSSLILENSSSGTAGLQITGAAGSSHLDFMYGGGPSTGTNTLTTGMSMTLEGSGAGNVGIGNTGPSEKLQVSNGTIRVDGSTNGLRMFKDGSADISSHLYLANAVNNRGYNWQLNATGDAVDFWTYGGSSWANRITYTASGNVGIGTSSPTSGGGLTLSSSTTAQGFIDFKNTVDGDSGFIGNAKALVTGGTTNQLGVRGGTSGIAFSVASAEAMRIDSTGNLLVGTT